MNRCVDTGAGGAEARGVDNTELYRPTAADLPGYYGPRPLQVHKSPSDARACSTPGLQPRADLPAPPAPPHAVRLHAVPQLYTPTWAGEEEEQQLGQLGLPTGVP